MEDDARETKSDSEDGYEGGSEGEGGSASGSEGGSEGGSEEKSHEDDVLLEGELVENMDYEYDKEKRIRCRCRVGCFLIFTVLFYLLTEEYLSRFFARF